jgi:hypothetical protein
LTSELGTAVVWKVLETEKIGEVETWIGTVAASLDTAEVETDFGIVSYIEDSPSSAEGA